MPRFDYQCPECRRVVELQASPWVEQTPVCEMCPNFVHLEKLPSAPSFTIKGFSAKNGYSK